MVVRTSLSARIFISHDGDDKPVITPFVHALLEEGFGLFVDRPLEVGIKADDTRVEGIALTTTAEDWPDGIRRGLNLSDIVLVFWTKNSIINDGHVLKAEINYADVSSKICTVILGTDAEDAKHIHGNRPQLLSDNQYIDLTGSGADPAAVRAAEPFRLLVRRLKLMAEAPVAEPKPEGVLPAVLAKMVNRDEAMRALHASARAAIHQAARRDRPQPGGGLIVSGQEADRLEYIGDRFLAMDGPGVLRAMTDTVVRNTPWADAAEWNLHRMRIGRSDSAALPPGDFREIMAGEMDRLFMEKPLRGRAGRSPVLASMHLYPSWLGRDAQQLIGIWLSAWDEALAEPPDVPVLPVLYISGPPAGRSILSFLGFSSGPPPIAEITRAAAAEAGLRHFEVAIADRIGPIGWGNANDWMRDYIAERVRGRVETHVSGLFRESERTYPMRDFYDAVMKLEPFRSGQPL